MFFQPLNKRPRTWLVDELLPSIQWSQQVARCGLTGWRCVNDTGEREIMAENNTTPAGDSSRPSTRRKVWKTIAIIAGIAIVWLALALFFAVKAALRKAWRMECQYNLRQIGLDCREYAAGHVGRFPSTWVELNFVGEETNWARVLRCPSTEHAIGVWTNVDFWADYHLLPGRTTNDPPDTILALEPLANHESKGANVLLVDGSTQWWPVARILGPVGGMVTNGATK
jgi:hypothetical protein